MDLSRVLSDFDKKNKRPQALRQILHHVNPTELLRYDAFTVF